MKKLILACSLVGACLPAFAESDFCATSSVTAPAIPQSVSTDAELIDLHSEVASFIENAEKHLICESSTRSYNELVDNMHETADRFNRLLTSYKASYKSASL